MLRRDARPEVRRQAVSVVERNVALLARLIGDLLDASRIASGKLEIERGVLDLVDVMRTAVAALEPAARRARRRAELRGRRRRPPSSTATPSASTRWFGI